MKTWAIIASVAAVAVVAIVAIGMNDPRTEIDGKEVWRYAAYRSDDGTAWLVSMAPKKDSSNSVSSAQRWATRKEAEDWAIAQIKSIDGYPEAA